MITMEKVILLACGSFNPITIMHLRMFELARDFLRHIGKYSVIGGVISPVHDAYGIKKNLVPSYHRLEMVRLATSTNSWIRASSWECTENESWTRTCNVLQHHQGVLNDFMNGKLSKKEDWFPDGLLSTDVVKVRLLCGADVLESFNIPDLWSDEHMTEIVRDYGLAVITRQLNGCEPEISIAKNPILTKFKDNIFVIPERISNDISSTAMRNSIREGNSVRYFVPDPVINYIMENQLYLN